jgi:hypothetical protein
VEADGRSWPAERVYLQRNMTVAKASQLADGDCRRQCTGVKSIVESLHWPRQASLRRSYQRSLKIMELQHWLCELARGAAER